VRRLEEVVVRASPLHDMLSSQSVQIVTREDLRTLPVDRVTDAIGLKAGVVVQGEELHVRGGRTGETALLLQGLALNETRRGTPMELPLLAIESVELVSGGLDAEHGGGLAGVVQARTSVPGSRWSGEARWETDAGISGRFMTPTQYDRVAARASGPVAGGWGIAIAGDVLTDDTYLPTVISRTNPRSWRADNRLLGFAKIAPVGSASGPAFEVLASRIVDRPYNPLWSLNGYTTPCVNPLLGCEPGFSTEPLPGYQRFIGGDHQAMSDEGRIAAILSASRAVAGGRLRGAAGWLSANRLTSIGGNDDEWYLRPVDGPRFGIPDSPNTDPFYAYYGYEPFFHRSATSTWLARADFDRATSVGNRTGFGAGLTYDHVTLRELDVSTRLPSPLTLDSLRSYEAFAPGGFAYGQARWVYEGMVVNGGLRLEYFTAGPQAERQSFGGPARGFWTISPRLGVAYPTSTRDVLSFSYVRLDQAPPRDFLYENRVQISNRQPLGNPGLQPSTVVSFQAALKHLFDQGRALQIAFFYRDLFGQIGARAFEVRPNVFMRRYENEDKGKAQGFELGWIHPMTTGRYEIQYTFMNAEGTASQPEGFPYGPLFQRPIDPTGDHPLDWDRTHSLSFIGQWSRPSPQAPATPRGPIEALLTALRGAWTASWATRVGSPFPWTPSRRNATSTDPALINSARFKWEENTSLGVRWSPALSRGHLWVGLDVRNLFDFRSERAATASGYPHPTINTVFDDDGAFRGETGLPGGAYWDQDRDAIGDYWVRIHDPRLLNPPRLVRLSVSVPW
ncbi:MAG TPA: TonB-dependent receptor, partial [Candidatus Eisenbacteria bacterium]|nr:TonB-dependent receptor [Candidatus Eisenbacteria bacterium]